MAFDVHFSEYLDLRGTPCPLNYIRCRLALEKLSPKQILHVDLDTGEPEEMVVPGLINDGHHVEIIKHQKSWLTLKVTCGE